MVAFVASTVLTAAALNSSFNALAVRTTTGTSDTLTLADNGGMVTYSNAGAIVATIPPFSSVAYATGTIIRALNLGVGIVTLTAGAGVTISGTAILAQNESSLLVKTATNTWVSLTGGGGGGATGGGADEVFYENGQTVTTNYTLTASTNAVTAGPITIDGGVTVTIPSGSSWVVV